MRIAALALLALTGAAPAATDITPAASCTLDRAATEAAFRALPVVGTEDDTEAGERGTIYSLGGASLWGAPAGRITFSDYADPGAGTALQNYEVAAQSDYTPARDRLLAATGKAKCDRETSLTDMHRCDIAFAPEAGWAKSLTLVHTGGQAQLICTFRKG